MAEAVPDWKGLFEWSMKYQDGTRPVGDVQPMKPEDRAWFEEAMKHYTVDISQRMKAIKATLDEHAAEESEELVRKKEALLEELIEIVENIDYAKDLTKIGGLETLMGLLQDAHPSLRARAAEVAATCVQINPPVQEWFMRSGALPKLLLLLDDPDPTCRTKGVLAISCLIRNNPAGLNAFLASSGVSKLVALLQEDNPRLQRKALQLLTHIAHEKPFAVPNPQVLPLMLRLIDSADKEIREAALALFLQLARDPEALAELRKDTALRSDLRKKKAALDSLDVEELESHRDELDHIHQLLHLWEQGPKARTQPPADRRATDGAHPLPQQPVLALTGPSGT